MLTEVVTGTCVRDLASELREPYFIEIEQSNTSSACAAPVAKNVYSAPAAKESGPSKEASAGQSSRSISVKSSHTKGKKPTSTQPRAASRKLGSTESTRMAVPTRNSSRFTGTLETGARQIEATDCTMTGKLSPEDMSPATPAATGYGHRPSRQWAHLAMPEVLSLLMPEKDPAAESQIPIPGQHLTEVTSDASVPRRWLHSVPIPQSVIHALAHTATGEWVYKYVGYQKLFREMTGRNGCSSVDTSDDIQVIMPQAGVRKKRWLWLSVPGRAILWSKMRPKGAWQIEDTRKCK